MSANVGPSHELGFSSLTTLSNLLADKSISPDELATELTQRIIQVDDCTDGLNSVIALNSEIESNESAFDSNKPLSGIPMLIKDNIECVGLPATAGSLALAGRTVDRDAPLVTALKNSGAAILGSTNLSEWANIRSGNSTSGWSAIGGLTANPWNYAHSAGGSSSGSGAAVSAGLVPVAIGTETDGSIVCPASLNGIVGIKPTVGSVSTAGIIPISFSQDSPGPLARNTCDAVKVLEVLLGRFDLTEELKSDQKVSVGVIRQWLTTDSQTNSVFENQLDNLAKAGFNLIELEVADMTDDIGNDETTVLLNELVHTMDNYLVGRSGSGVKSLADVVEFNKLNSDTELKYFGQEYFEIATKSGGLTDSYHEARARNLDWAKSKVLDPALAKVDVLIGIPYGPAWKSDLINGDDFESASWMTNPAAIAGYPIASLPMGFVEDLPVGLGIIAGANSEAKLVRALSQFEKVFEICDQIPSFKKA